MVKVKDFFVQPFVKIYKKFKSKWDALDENPEWMVSREGWGARPAKPPEPPLGDLDDTTLKIPVSYVVIHDTTNYDDPGTDSERIKEVLREIQEDDMAEDWRDYEDIGYNFMVGGDGKVYVGTGWTTEGGHTVAYNDDSIGIALIGNHRNKPPNSAMLLATYNLILEGVRKRYLKGDVKVVPHSALLKGARCPSKHLEKAVERGIFAVDIAESEWAWLWTVKRWLNELPQNVRDHIKGQIEFWIDEWKTCSTRQFINYYWHN